jgi:hypothetical protein
MTEYIILALCVLILLSYLFDITSFYSRIPGVLLLVGLGIVMQIVIENTDIKIPDMQPLLPVLGTLGLILIVMEATLDLRVEREKTGIILKSVSAAIVLFAIFITIMTFIMVRFLDYGIIDSLLNSIPFGIISSAVAISSSVNLNKEQREFIIYESSISDIIGILVFDFILIYGSAVGFGLLNFAFKGVLTVLIAIVVTTGLAFLLHKATYHINYIIILTVLVMVYVLGELIHLPALLLVMAFGIALANHSLVEKSRFSRFIDFDKFRTDLSSFRKIITELTFVVRSFFFIMFGYYSRIEGLFNFGNLLTAIAIVTGIYLLRIIFLVWFLKIPVIPYLFFSPRGLVTILLFLGIPATSRVSLIGEEVVTLVILLTLLFMMAGNFLQRKEEPFDPQVMIGSEGAVSAVAAEEAEDEI